MSNVEIYKMDKIFDNPRDEVESNKDDPVLLEFYTDWSCLPNPWAGGSGYFSTDFETTARIEPINHDTMIGCCELNGIRMV